MNEHVRFLPHLRANICPVGSCPAYGAFFMRSEQIFCAANRQRHFGGDRQIYKHNAQAGAFVLKEPTRLRVVLIWPTKLAPSN